MIKIDSNMAAIRTWMKAIAKLGDTKVKGVDFLGLDRTDGKGGNNADVANHIAEWNGKTRKTDSKTLVNRDPFKPDDSQSEEIAEAFAKKADTELQKAANRISKVVSTSKIAISKSAAADKVATAIAGESFKAAMDHWRQIVVANIKGNKAAGGPATKVLEDYAAQRRNDEAVPEDSVFEATGDLLENFENKKAAKLTRG